MLGQSGDYGLPPSQVSAVFYISVLAGHYFGAPTIRKAEGR